MRLALEPQPEIMAIEDLRVNQLEWSVADVKQAIKLLTQLALKTDERMESLMAAQARSEDKIAELAAAQIRTEEAILRLSTALESVADSQSSNSSDK